MAQRGLAGTIYLANELQYSQLICCLKRDTAVHVLLRISALVQVIIRDAHEGHED
jgi:hypothetical protein